MTCEQTRFAFAASDVAVERHAVDLLQVTSLVLWLTCLGVGLLGLGLRYPFPAAQQKKPPPIAVQIADVQISNDPLIAAGATDAGARSAEVVAPPSPPAMAALAEPSPSIALATPAAGEGRVVDSRHANSGARAPNSAGVTGAPRSGAGSTQHLIYGQGLGSQPEPDYPREAKVAGEQGAVVVEFDVGEDGRVSDARITGPCRWPLLNQSAIQAVRHRWRYAPGPLRRFDITIRFELR